MKTQKQVELINSFLSELGDETGALYHEIIMSLVELDYNPQKERSHISFKHDLHNKQMAKMGIKKGKEPSPFFSLIYKHTVPGSELKTHCGAFALEIPNITANDIPEIKKLLKKEHEYLLEHEADRT